MSWLWFYLPFPCERAASLFLCLYTLAQTGNEAELGGDLLGRWKRDRGAPLYVYMVKLVFFFSDQHRSKMVMLSTICDLIMTQFPIEEMRRIKLPQKSLLSSYHQKDKKKQMRELIVIENEAILLCVRYIDSGVSYEMLFCESLERSTAFGSLWVKTKYQ